MMCMKLVQIIVDDGYHVCVWQISDASAFVAFQLLPDCSFFRCSPPKHSIKHNMCFFIG